jgi:hypothetical protein
VYRYSLTPTDMGISRDSFVSQYMMLGHTRLSTEELSDEQSKHLESWAKGLFGPDGITEEVTGSCRPQQFYMLVPTLFSQTLLACSQGHLVMDTVKNNLECKSEPMSFNAATTCTDYRHQICLSHSCYLLLLVLSSGWKPILARSQILI